jgi:hypothetical protein
MLQFPMRQTFALLGRPATYTPISGPAVTCRVKRVAAGRETAIGAVRVVADTSTYHLLRDDVPAPAEGDVLTVDGASFTIDAVEPCENDPEDTRWQVHGSWGVQMAWHRPSEGVGPAYPPQGSNFKIAAAASGATSVTIDSAFVAGMVKAGDTFEIAGDATVYTVQGDKTATTGGFVGLSIDPGLAEATTGGEAVTFTFNGEVGVTIRAAIADYEVSEILGGVRAGDRRLVIRGAAAAATGRTRVEVGDEFTFADETWRAETARGIYQGDTLVAWDVQVRR